MKKEILRALAWIFVAMIVIYIEEDNLIVGKIINSIFPCKQELMSSFPCYAVYDVVLVLIMVAVIISIALISVSRFTRHQMGK
jgi:hypothetical protein